MGPFDRAEDDNRVKSSNNKTWRRAISSKLIIALSFYIVKGVQLADFVLQVNYSKLMSPFK
jgi:hypothetical protein